MRHVLITIGTAAAVVATFLLLRAVAARAEAGTGPAVREARTPVAPAESRAEAASSALGSPVIISGLPEFEALHREHGVVGAAMRDFLAVARGSQWNNVDRERMQAVVYAIRNSATEADVAYLLDLFNRTPDPAFRWWFSWLVQQIPDERFVDALTEVYRLDPHRGLDALAAINKPSAKERFLKLLDAEANPEVRQHAVVALAHSDWDGREEAVSAIARDAGRADAERIEALTALGRTGYSSDSMTLLMDVALGPAKRVSGLNEALTRTHPIPDLRSAAVLAIMQRGDQEAWRRLIEAADAPGGDPDLQRIVDLHTGSFTGPDITEFIYDRARKRGFVSAGEVMYLIRDLEQIDRARLRDLLPLVRDPETKALLQKILSER